MTEIEFYKTFSITRFLMYIGFVMGVLYAGFVLVEQVQISYLWLIILPLLLFVPHIALLFYGKAKGYLTL